MQVSHAGITSSRGHARVWVCERSLEPGGADLDDQQNCPSLPRLTNNNDDLEPEWQLTGDLDSLLCIVDAVFIETAQSFARQNLSHGTVILASEIALFDNIRRECVESCGIHSHCYTFGRFGELGARRGGDGENCGVG